MKLGYITIVMITQFFYIGGFYGWCYEKNVASVRGARFLF